MEGKDIIMMTQEELKNRQIRRLLGRVREEGDAGITHKSRGKESNRRLPEKIRKKVIKLYRQKYNGFGPTLLSEKLFEEEALKISDETLRLWLIETGDIKKRRKHKRNRQWRGGEKEICGGIPRDGERHTQSKSPQNTYP